MFSSKSWHKLGVTEKSQHSFSNCKGCIKSKIYKHLLTLFPVKYITYGRKAALTLYQSGEEKSKMVADAKILLKKADNEFKKKFPFTPIECLVPSIPKSSLVAKPSKSVLMAQKNSYARSFKSIIDANLQETAFGRLLFIRTKKKIIINFLNPKTSSKTIKEGEGAGKRRPILKLILGYVRAYFQAIFRLYGYFQFVWVLLLGFGSRFENFASGGGGRGKI